MSYVEPKLWEHQQKVLNLVENKKEFALFWEAGTGKTLATIQILRQKMNKEKRKLRTLILSPVIILPTWEREIKKFSKIQDPVLLKGSQVKRCEQFREALKFGSHVFILNYEGMLMKDLMELIMEWRPEVLVCDESHRIKGYNTKTTQAVTKIADLTLYRFILSGTPILNSGFDIFSQFRVLDKGETFSTNFFKFRGMYFYDANSGMPSHKYFPNWKPQPQAYKEFNQLIYKKAMRVKKDDCLDLPPMVRVKIPVALSEEQEKLYKEMERDFITYLNDSAVVANMALTKALRLQQIVTGFVKDAEGKETILKENPRIAALESLLEDHAETSKIIIWCAFRVNYAQVSALLHKMKIKHVGLTGDTGKDRQTNIDAFQNDPSVRVLIANQSAASEGITLTASNISIYYSRTFNLGHDIQSEARNYRGGSEIHTKVTRFDLVAEETIDSIVLEALENKMNLSENILALKERFLTPKSKG